ncbi:hypothetical protein P2O63_23850, partial [Escherichia coli]|uniref:hypothetical protein n=1 Tax=Escherichia coli TaxID=562 RepID=UPI001FF6A7C7
KRAYCLKTQPATGETYPKSDLFNKASAQLYDITNITINGTGNIAGCFSYDAQKLNFSLL